MLDIKKLIWDSWNTAHIARHGVVPDEVENVCGNNPKTEQTYKGRIMIIGSTNIRRVLAIVLELENEQDNYYPITARDASKKERNR